MEPGGREAAPGGLILVQAFVNTNDIEGKHDQLATPEHLRDWLARHGLPVDDSLRSQADLHKVLAVREALRALALANNGGPLSAAAVRTLDWVGTEVRLRVRFDPGGRARLEPASAGVSGALDRILAEVYAAMAAGTWPRLKACRNDACRWVFYDRSKNRSGAWCTMSICGEKLKARAYRRRRAGV